MRNKTSFGLATGISILVLAGAVQAQDHIGNFEIDGSLCVGNDCLASESFGFDTIKLKENNLRIKFDDTSTTASFPSNDWQLTANDSANGGSNKFSIDDVTGGRTPFTIEAAAPSNSLFVENSGQVGFGTNNPVVELHSVNGDTPTLRLEQNGSSGFTPQTWDVAGNEAGFFIRDATNGSTLPFRIRPGAASQSLVIDGENEVGVGILNASASLHVYRSDGTAALRVEEVNGTDAARELLHLANNGQVAFVIEDTSIAAGDNTGREWKFQNRDGELRVTTAPGGAGEVEMALNVDGDLTISGNFFASSGTQLNVPDYVFEEGYELMPLNEVAAFISENGHLPRVPSAEEVNRTGLNMTQMQMALLEKIEELTLYTLSQERTIQELNTRLEKIGG